MLATIINWFTIYYEWYLLVGFGFSMLDVYLTLNEYHDVRRYSNVKLSKWAYISPFVMWVFYPIIILIWTLNVLAKWK